MVVWVGWDRAITAPLPEEAADPAGMHGGRPDSLSVLASRDPQRPGGRRRAQRVPRGDRPREAYAGGVRPAPCTTGDTLRAPDALAGAAALARPVEGPQDRQVHRA